MWFANTLREWCEQTGRRFNEMIGTAGDPYLQKDEPFKWPASHLKGEEKDWEVVLTQRAYSLAGMRDVRFSHMIRDPRDMVVSGQRYHKWCHEKWAKVPKREFDWRSYQHVLRDLDNEEGLLFELEYFGRMSTLAMWKWPYYGDPRCLNLRYEDVIYQPKQMFRKLFEHYGLGDVEKGVECALKHSFESRSGRRLGEEKEGDHYRKGTPNDWKIRFTPTVVAEFKRQFGQALIDLGYEKDFSWGV